MYTVKELPSGVINKATKALNTKYGKPLVNCNGMWRDWWKKDYNVEASVGWTEYIFESEQAYTMFLLKWS
jgi:hypothetical protein